MKPSANLSLQPVAAAVEHPTLTALESLAFNRRYAIPNYLRGIFTPNRLWSGIGADASAVELVAGLRRKYHSEYLYVSMLGTRSLLVLDADGIRHVLEHSPEIYADPKLKRKGMSHFQPDALTISRGDDWRERRRFNEAVLDTGQLHRHGDAFLVLIRDETGASLQRAGAHLAWPDIATLFERITLQIVFGRGFAEQSVLDDLRRMMHESNRGFALGKSRYFDAFYQKLGQGRREAGEPSLASRCNQLPATAQTRIDNQIPHWLFAMADTLAINTARALALILAHPEAQTRVREELAAEDLGTAQGIQSLRYLEGCVQEAMRLWPTTPMLVRETLKEDTLGGATVAAGTQVIILNSFNHRDGERLAFADRFTPQLWLERQEHWLFNHMSNGPQGCAGRQLALFIAKAVLANMLMEQRYVLERPPLDASAPLPHAYNHFDLRFARSSGGGST